MSGNREQVREIFDRARRLTKPERAAFLDGLATVDGSMRTQIEDMLAALDEAGLFLSEPTQGHVGDSPTADTASAQTTLAAPLLEGPGTRIGPYKLLQLIGEGGFGTVFMAEQTAPVQRKVALKIIKLGMDTRQVVARFEQERQALAMMDHPNIARVLDAGATETGRPFFVMELVKGEEIVKYCDRNNLSIEDRLELFAQVCNAVQHAHTKGIIHRDIKPSNILVSTQDGRPHTKVIDFGIAKATASKLTEKTLFTEHKALIGTPEYMSPEQAEGSLDIDTRTDVYSLGVLLYELLTGTTPFSSQELRSAAYAEIQRIIREVEPPKPSTRISQNTDTIASIATKRHTEPKRLGTIVRGELDWIVMKALEKDRQRRYETANGLAADIKRYLSGEAVVAAPPSTAYRFKKFIRRNRVMVTAGGAVAAALLIGVVAFAWQAKIARDQRDLAVQSQIAEVEQRKLAETAKEQESKARMRAENINVFVTKALRSGDSLVGGKKDATIAEAMDRAIKDIDAGAFKDDPETEVRMRATIASVLEHNGRAVEADPLVSKLMEAAQGFLDNNNPDGPIDFARAMEMGKRIGEADPNLSLGLDSFRSKPRAWDLAARAEPFLVKALEAARRRFTGDHPDLAMSLSVLASWRNGLGRPAEAEPLAVEALEMERRLYKGDHRQVVGALAFLANVRADLGRCSEAEPLLAEALEMHRRLKGDSDHEAELLHGLAGARLALGRAAEAEALFVEALEMDRRQFKGDHLAVAGSLSSLARARQALGKTAEARHGFDEAIAMARRLTPSGSTLLARVLWRSGSAHLENKDVAAALSELEEAVAMAGKFFPPDHKQLKEYRETLATCKAALAEQGKPDAKGGGG